MQANLLAAVAAAQNPGFQIFNVASGRRTTLNELFALIQEGLVRRHATMPRVNPVYGAFRTGDVRHSLADISRAQSMLGYGVSLPLNEAIERTLDWFGAQLAATVSPAER